jgi:hypothetical protein
MEGTMSSASRTLEARLETIGDGFVLLLLAAISLPGGTVARLAVMLMGVLLLGLNVTRLMTGVEVRLMSTTIGAWATIAGAGALAELGLNLFALFFLLLGLGVVASAVVRPR